VRDVEAVVQLAFERAPQLVTVVLAPDEHVGG
jgi:hypothetical protein